MPTARSSGVKRESTIDYLRAISILLMIVIHVSPYYPHDAVATYLWIWGQWVVPAFILCSVAVDRHTVRTSSQYVRYLAKRLRRLLPPYYIWLALYASLVVLLGRETVSIRGLGESALLTGGFGYNWLIVLFIGITVALPFLKNIAQRSEVQSMIVLAVCHTVSALYIANRSYWGGWYRLNMIIPWWGVTLSILLFLRWWKDRDWARVITLLLVHLGMFVYWYRYFNAHGITIHTFHHKYPPDIYFTSFAVWSVILSYLVTVYISPILDRARIVPRVLASVSVYSYRIFFIHILVLYTLRHITSPLHPSFVTLCFTVLASTGIVTWVTTRVRTNTLLHRMIPLRARRVRGHT